MLARQRQERILDQVRATGGVRVSDLAEILDVSDMTIRRDIAVLAGRGVVSRVHGGVTAIRTRSTDEPCFAARSGLHPGEKRGIAAAAARLVAPGDSVALSAGTTTYAVAQHLLQVPQLTVVTNSVPVEEVFRTRPREDRTVILTGGVRTPSDALVGPVAVAALRSLHADWLFLGVHGVDERAGYTTPNLEEAETNRALIASARQVVVVADSTKWGVVGLSSMARLDDVDVLVTDRGLPSEIRRALVSRIGRLVLAESENAENHDTDNHGKGADNPDTGSNTTHDRRPNGGDSHAHGTDSNT